MSIKQVQAYKKVRLLGSAALSLAYVAAGRADAYYEKDIMIWDIAAGVALVTGAGGAVRIKPSLMNNSVTVHAYNNCFKP
jgi:myo-inositol-1(or 4)-monophosphatase